MNLNFEINSDYYLPKKDEFDLSGQNFIIFGGSSGIGLGIGVGLGKAGASIIVIGRDEIKLDSSIKFLKENEINAKGIQGSITDSDLLSNIDNFLEATDTKINGVVLSAALSHIENSENYPLSKVKEIIDMNLYSHFAIVQWAGKRMRTEGGSIIFISSGAAKKAMPKNVIYSSTKSALIGLARSLAVEWARYNIRINTIIPGWIETQMTYFLTQHSSSYEKIKSRIPLQRWGYPKDFAGVVVWLMSTSYVTGAEITIDGGLLIS